MLTIEVESLYCLHCFVNPLLPILFGHEAAKLVELAPKYLIEPAVLLTVAFASVPWVEAFQITRIATVISFSDALIPIISIVKEREGDFFCVAACIVFHVVSKRVDKGTCRCGSETNLRYAHFPSLHGDFSPFLQIYNILLVHYSSE